ncbi:MAG: hypothetical protein R3D71_08385 [Rickettsiales bacterium]
MIKEAGKELAKLGLISIFGLAVLTIANYGKEMQEKLEEKDKALRECQKKKNDGYTVSNEHEP